MSRYQDREGTVQQGQLGAGLSSQLAVSRLTLCQEDCETLGKEQRQDVPHLTEKEAASSSLGTN